MLRILLPICAALLLASSCEKSASTTYEIFNNSDADGTVTFYSSLRDSITFELQSDSITKILCVEIQKATRIIWVMDEDSVLFRFDNNLCIPHYKNVSGTIRSIYYPNNWVHYRTGNHDTYTYYIFPGDLDR